MVNKIMWPYTFLSSVFILHQSVSIACVIMLLFYFTAQDNILFSFKNSSAFMLTGSSESLYESVHKKIFTLPDETLVFPGHDYKGMYIKQSNTCHLGKIATSRLRSS